MHKRILYALLPMDKAITVRKARLYTYLDKS